MKKLLMATALVSSLAAASAFAHEKSGHNHVFHVKGDHVGTDVRGHIREKMEKDGHHECHKYSLSLGHIQV